MEFIFFFFFFFGLHKMHAVERGVIKCRSGFGVVFVFVTFC
jgi:hypothetical protein